MKRNMNTLMMTTLAAMVLFAMMISLSACQKSVVCSDGRTVAELSMCKDTDTEKDTGKIPSEEKACPASCEDRNACTSDICNIDTDYACTHPIITPCCGNGACEKGETYTSCKTDCPANIDPRIVELQTKAALKRGMSYSYRQVNFNDQDAASSVLSFEVMTIDNYTRYSYPTTQYYKKNTAEHFVYTSIVLDSTTEQAYLLDVIEYETDQAKKVWYETYYLKSSKDYLMEITEGTLTPMTGNYDGKDTSTITYPLSRSITRTIKISDFDGLPVVVEDYDNDKEYLVQKIEFKSLNSNRNYRNKDVWLPDDVEVK